MKVGDLVRKKKGVQAGRVGVITRIYNSLNQAHVILEVLSEGNVEQWAASWCEQLGDKNDDR